MSFDNLCKLLAEKNPKNFTQWLVGHRPNEVTILKPELSIEPIRADSVTLLKAEGRILHIEFQTRWQSEPSIPFRMLDYWVRLYRDSTHCRKEASLLLRAAYGWFEVR